MRFALFAAAAAAVASVLAVPTGTEDLAPRSQPSKSTTCYYECAEVVYSKKGSKLEFVKAAPGTCTYTSFEQEFACLYDVLSGDAKEDVDVTCPLSLTKVCTSSKPSRGFAAGTKSKRDLTAGERLIRSLQYDPKHARVEKKRLASQ